MSVLRCWLVFCTFTFALAVFEDATIEISDVKRAAGDIIYSHCQDVKIQGQNIPNVCVELVEDESCGVIVNFTAAGQPVVYQHLDLLAEPEACGNYKISGMDCQICVALQKKQDDLTKRCITVSPICLTLPLGTVNLGCFDESLLSNVENCNANMCPNGCSAHGQCVNGQCSCDSGYYGSDCSATSPLFEKCEQVDDLGGDLCARVSYSMCNIKFELVVEGGGAELPIYDKDYSVRYVSKIFSSDQCVNLAGCDICLRWNALNINKSAEVSGCGNMTIECPLAPPYQYYLGCFDDDEVLPACFVCPNNCSGHGTCDDYGMCTCKGDYVGDDCSATKSCPNDCSGNGNCNSKGVCECSKGWAGQDCSIEVPDSQSSGSPSRVSPAAIIIPIVVLIIIGGVGGAVYYYKKKRSAREPGFTQMDLITADDEDQELAD
eukprot:TRINITY_DN593_c0_g1_i3.p1 TRINITY_DN593_c0_g1~~TRINITY_DN593_c0_g1_i3.p1  ORF type:complete len:434 (+),score=78.23 TRINITY_DN593_c0_g1_i3:141-1442(+)